ncbi:hypothetical protein A3860_14425 [Niastella vici]|uniref:Uncharacterized protein n=1 Tax=Niastella vici TaxID=1703345 RepID=A0A1V9G5E3_9BACT|nr:hypothetical protein [Niastella vici]OQP65790.1 hypothetical protein A3860_14425 [Niastella vici]
MKYLLSLLIATLLVIASCKKDHDDGIPAGEDYGCIDQMFIKTKDHTINSADVPTVDKLFSANRIDNSKFRYYQYKRDSVAIGPPYTIVDRKLIWVEQFDRDRRVFNGDQIFQFYNDTFNSVGWHTIGYNWVNVSNLDTIPRMSLARVRRLFRHDLEKYFPTDSNAQRIDYSDTCFIAEFGFYKQLADKYYTAKFYKAWRVFKKNSVNDRPAGYYDDETGRQLSFYLF